MRGFIDSWTKITVSAMEPALHVEITAEVRVHNTDATCTEYERAIKEAISKITCELESLIKGQCG